MTSHWPTFADGKFWCACDNRTFETEDEWQMHVLKALWLDTLPPHEINYISPNTGEVECRCGWKAADTRNSIFRAVEGYAQHRVEMAQPSESSSGHAAPSR